MTTLVTGAAGFLGRALVARLQAAAAPLDRLRLLDRVAASATDAEILVGDLADLAVLEAALDGVDRVFHLAALPGGAAEAGYAASLRVNLQASLDLFEHLAARTRPARLVYASSIAVFGAPLPEAGIDDETPARPSMTYGAHKLMVETALANLTRLGRIGGVALRLPGLVARPSDGAGLKSAFMSQVFHTLAAGEAYALPVGPDATMWLMSVQAAARALIHAADLPTLPRAAFTAPALRVSAGDLVAEISRQARGDPGLVTYDPDPVLEAQFGRLPPLFTPAADGLGFVHDGDLSSLVSTTLASLRKTTP
jgi:nucleoside-diphosphate-sugar epimerase